MTTAAQPVLGLAATRPARAPAVAVALAGLSMAIFFVAYLWTGSSQLLLLALATCPVVILLVPQLLQRSFDLFAPLSFVALAALFGVTLRTLYIVLVDDRTTREMLLLGQPLDILLPAALLIDAALAFLVVGYLVPWPRLPLHRVPLLGGEWSDTRLKWVVAALVAAGLASTALYMDRLDIEIGQLAELSVKRRLELPGADYGYASLGYHLWGMSLLSLAFYLLLTRLALSRRRLLSPLGLSTLAAAALAAFPPFLTSSRTGVLVLLVHAAIVWNYARRPLTGRRVAGAVLAALLVFSLMAGLRSMGQRAEGPRADLDLASLSGAVLANRNWLDVTKTAHLMEAVPEDFDYLHGRSFLTWAVAPIPRTVWPDKPVVRVGVVLGQEVFGKESGKSGVPPGFIGELYINFGGLGVLAGMFGLGAVLRLLYDGFWPVLATDGAALLVYTLSILPLAFSLVANDFSGMIVGVARSLIGLAVVLPLVRQPGSRRAAASVPPGSGRVTSPGRP